MAESGAATTTVGGDVTAFDTTSGGTCLLSPEPGPLAEDSVRHTARRLLPHGGDRELLH